MWLVELTRRISHLPRGRKDGGYIADCGRPTDRDRPKSYFRKISLEKCRNGKNLAVLSFPRGTDTKVPKFEMSYRLLEMLIALLHLVECSNFFCEAKNMHLDNHFLCAFSLQLCSYFSEDRKKGLYHDNGLSLLSHLISSHLHVAYTAHCTPPPFLPFRYLCIQRASPTAPVVRVNS